MSVRPPSPASRLRERPEDRVMTAASPGAGRDAAGSVPRGSRAPGRSAFALSTALVVVAVPACAATVLVPGLLRGPAVMNGSARGTALVLLVLTVPALLLAMLATRRRAAWAPVVWVGVSAHMLYNAVLLVFGTPVNPAFPGYLAMLGLSLWSGAAVLTGLDADALAGAVRERLPVRAIAGFVGAVAGLNALAWLARIAQGPLTHGTPSFLAGTGLTTNPVIDQDLAIWLPLALLVAVQLWRRRPWGYAGAGAVLVFWLLEGPTVALDQAWGHAADPASTVAGGSAVRMFAVVTAVTLVPALAYFGALRGRAHAR
jgi:hypothetical protein